MMRYLVLLFAATLARADVTMVDHLGAFTDYTTTNSFVTINTLHVPGALLVSIICANTGSDSADWQVLAAEETTSTIQTTVKASATILTTASGTYAADAHYIRYIVQAKSTVADTPTTLKCRAAFK